VRTFLSFREFLRFISVASSFGSAGFGFVGGFRGRSGEIGG
jgi:hypothetical protein